MVLSDILPHSFWILSHFHTLRTHSRYHRARVHVVRSQLPRFLEAAYSIILPCAILLEA